MKKGFIIGSMLFALGAMALVGCGRDENRNQAKKWRKDAEELAVKYVQEKYGFDNPQVVGATSVKSSADIFEVANSTPLTNVVMMEGTKKYTVQLDATDKSNKDARDNYQKDEICAAFEEVISELSSHDIEEVNLVYWTPNKSENYFAHGKYDVSKNATAYEKAENLRNIFNKEYVTGGNDKYPQLFIQAYFVSDDLTDLEEETQYIAQDVLGINAIYLYEIAFRSDADYREATSQMKSTVLIDPGMELYMNGYSLFRKQERYKGESVSARYSHCTIDGRKCVVEGCDAAEADIYVVDADMSFSDDYGITKQRISDMYHISLPEDAKLTIYFPEDEFSGNVALGRRYYVKQANGNLRERYSITNSNKDNSFHINGYYCAGGENNTEVCLLKD